MSCILRFGRLLCLCTEFKCCACCDCRDRPSAAECMSHPWLWQQQFCLSPEPAATTRSVRERSCGTKWAAPPEDLEDKENFLESPHSHAKRFRFDEETLAAGDGDVWNLKQKRGGSVRQGCSLLPLSFLKKKNSCPLPSTPRILIYIPLNLSITKSTTQTKDNQLHFVICHWFVAVKMCVNCTVCLSYV